LRVLAQGRAYETLPKGSAGRERPRRGVQRVRWFGGRAPRKSAAGVPPTHRRCRRTTGRERAWPRGRCDARSRPDAADLHRAGHESRSRRRLKAFPRRAGHAGRMFPCHWPPRLHEAQIMAKVQLLVAPGGRFAQDRFLIVTDQATVTGPAHVRVDIRPKVEGRIGHMMGRRHGGRRARVRGRLRVAAEEAIAPAHSLLSVVGHP
jgi:hypothetical protein